MARQGIAQPVKCLSIRYKPENVGNMITDSRLSWITSDYLCAECKTPLYLEVEGKDESGACPNPACVLHPPGMGPVDVSRDVALKDEMRSRKGKLHSRILQTSQPHFVNYVYRQRLELIRSLLETGKANFETWLALDDLLIHISTSSPIGRERDLRIFASILSDYLEHFKNKCFIEDLENERYMMSTDRKVYVLKYWLPLLEFYRGYGIVSGSDERISEAFRYSEVDRQVKEKVELRFGEDWGKYFQQMFGFIIGLGYMFERQYITARQHRYDPTGIDIAVMLGLWASAREEVEEWSWEGLRRHFDRTSQGHEIFEDFYEKYVSGRSLSPVIVFDGRNYLFDKYTTLLYSLYLIGRNQRMSLGQDRAGAKDIAAKREEASHIFENRAREQLRKAGFVARDQPLKVREQNEEHEYDIIGVSEAKSQLVMAEAKYRDFAPSSISGKTLLKQELLDEDRLLDWASDAQRKLEFFRKNGARFEHELSLRKSTASYEVSMWVVTKYKPLISKYQSVRVADFWEFCREFPGR